MLKFNIKQISIYSFFILGILCISCNNEDPTEGDDDEIGSDYSAPQKLNPGTGSIDNDNTEQTSSDQTEDKIEESNNNLNDISDKEKVSSNKDQIDTEVNIDNFNENVKKCKLFIKKGVGSHIENEIYKNVQIFGNKKINEIINDIKISVEKFKKKEDISDSINIVIGKMIFLEQFYKVFGKRVLKIFDKKMKKFIKTFYKEKDKSKHYDIVSNFIKSCITYKIK